MHCSAADMQTGGARFDPLIETLDRDAAIHQTRACLDACVTCVALFFHPTAINLTSRAELEEQRAELHADVDRRIDRLKREHAALVKQIRDSLVRCCSCVSTWPVSR